METAIHDSIYPRPDYSLETVQIDGKDVVVLAVNKGNEGPYFYKGQVHHRSDTASAPIDKEEVRRLIMESDQISYEELPSTQDNLDFSVLKASLHKVIGVKNFDLDTLRTLGLFVNDQYNRAAQLLADENNCSRIYTDMVRFGNTESIFLERKTIVGKSLLIQYEEAMNFFDRWYHPFEEVVGFTR